MNAWTVINLTIGVGGAAGIGILTTNLCPEFLRSIDNGTLPLAGCILSVVGACVSGTIQYFCG